MPVTVESLGIDHLTWLERRKLIDDIWESMAAMPPEPMPISDELRAELRRRAAEDDADPDGGIPWEVVREELRAEFEKDQARRQSGSQSDSMT